MSNNYEPAITCEFNNSTCLCQWCEKPCNNGLQCHECNQNKKVTHNCYMCTGFIGIYPTGMHSDEIHEKAMQLLERNRI